MLEGSEGTTVDSSDDKYSAADVLRLFPPTGLLFCYNDLLTVTDCECNFTFRLIDVNVIDQTTIIWMIECKCEMTHYQEGYKRMRNPKNSDYIKSSGQNLQKRPIFFCH